MTEQTLLKVIDMARFGTGHEKENATAIVKRECEKKGYNFTEAMTGKLTTSKWHRAPNPGNTHFYGRSYGRSRSPFDDSDLSAAIQKMMEDLAQANRNTEELFRRAQAQAGMSQTYSTHTGYGGRKYKDKGGIEWTYDELKVLHSTKRLQLFGYDPLFT